MTTTLHKPEAQQRQWLLVDAKGKILGRLAVQIATLLRGKHKAAFTPYLDTGDFVVVINAGQIAVTGQKRTQKLYDRYSGYPSGRKFETLDTVLKRNPERVIREAVKGMLPAGPLGRQQLRKLKVYRGAEHEQAAQRPTPVSDQRRGATHGH